MSDESRRILFRAGYVVFLVGNVLAIVLDVAGGNPWMLFVNVPVAAWMAFAVWELRPEV